MRPSRLAMAAEWTAHAAVWLAWPSHAELWGEDLGPACAEFAALCRAISEKENEPATSGAGSGLAPEELVVLVPDATAEATARAGLAGVDVRFERIRFGDIWLRDTGPIFVSDAAGAEAAVRFRFNGWGEKYRYRFDDEVAQRIAERAGIAVIDVPFVLEGGAFEVDGQGTCLTTRTCLLNDNRNAGMGEEEMAGLLHDYLGVDHVVWLDGRLAGDHTDGHVDTLARFAGPGRVLCMEARDDDPNRDALTAVRDALERATDCSGRPFDVVVIPAPDLVSDREGEPLPASYLNFYIANTTVVVPVFGSTYDAAAVERIAECFTDRVTIGLPARHILAGGGAFHCITQQQPQHPMADAESTRAGEPPRELAEKARAR